MRFDPVYNRLLNSQNTEAQNVRKHSNTTTRTELNSKSVLKTTAIALLSVLSLGTVYLSNRFRSWAFQRTVDLCFDNQTRLNTGITTGELRRLRAYVDGGNRDFGDKVLNIASRYFRNLSAAPLQVSRETDTTKLAKLVLEHHDRMFERIDNYAEGVADKNEHILDERTQDLLRTFGPNHEIHQRIVFEEAAQPQIQQPEGALTQLSLGVPSHESVANDRADQIQGTIEQRTLSLLSDLMLPRPDHWELPVSTRYRIVLSDHADTVAELLANPEAIRTFEHSHLLPTSFLQILDTPVLRDLDGRTSLRGASVTSALDLIPNDAFERTDAELDFQVRKLDTPAGALKLLEDIQTDQLGDTVSDFLKTLIREYPDNLSLQDRRATLSGYFKELANRGQMSEAEHLAAFFKQSGPYMQKLLQLLGDNCNHEEFREALKSMKKDLPPIPTSIKAAQLANVIQESGGAIQSLSNIRTLGAASVGEALKATVKYASPDQETQTEEIIIKLRRPGIQNRAYRDRQHFDSTLAKTDSDTIKSMINAVCDQVDAELDFRKEARNIELGVRHYGHAEHRYQGAALELQGGKGPEETRFRDMNLVKPGEANIWSQCEKNTTVRVETTRLWNLDRAKIEPQEDVLLIARSPGTTLDDRINQLEQEKDPVLARQQAFNMLSRRPARRKYSLG